MNYSALHPPLYQCCPCARLPTAVPSHREGIKRLFNDNDSSNNESSNNMSLKNDNEATPRLPPFSEICAPCPASTPGRELALAPTNPVLRTAFLAEFGKRPSRALVAFWVLKRSEVRCRRCVSEGKRCEGKKTHLHVGSAQNFITAAPTLKTRDAFE